MSISRQRLKRVEAAIRRKTIKKRGITVIMTWRQPDGTWKHAGRTYKTLAELNKHNPHRPGEFTVQYNFARVSGPNEGKP